MKLLEDSGYSGPRHFDAHALRTEDEEGVWTFASGCMRTYLMLKEKAVRFGQDSEIQAALEAYRIQDEKLEAITSSYSRGNLKALREQEFDREALGSRGPGLELIDQLTVEILLGVR